MINLTKLSSKFLEGKGYLWLEGGLVVSLDGFLLCNFWVDLLNCGLQCSLFLMLLMLLFFELMNYFVFAYLPFLDFRDNIFILLYLIRISLI